MLKQTGNWGDKKQLISNGYPNLINDHFASIASDSHYNHEAVIKASLLEAHNAIKSPHDHYTTDIIKLLLARIGRTSPGNDDIPYWLYKDCACEIAQVVTKIINMSIDLGFVHSAWRTAAITPVPKCMPIKGLGDLRLISVTPILSRMVERLVVRDYISQPFPKGSVLINMVISQQAALRLR